MYHIDILTSLTTGKYYIGMTKSLDSRLKKHNSGATASTKSGRPWRIIYTETLSNKRAAWLREQQIKSYKGGEAFKKLIA